ncbi:MAG TPA: class I SAM-dependent methyltransferase [Sphingobium sp.]|uniref:class I SAM-dependent methyltransferase n=1 Tax=Sphingobium sp. TaxID=1912891 RepID=UPI002ED4A4BF
MLCPVCRSLGGLGLDMLGVSSDFYRNIKGENGVDKKKMILCGKCHAVFGSDIAFMNLAADAESQAVVNQDYYVRSAEIDNIDGKVDDIYAIISSFDRFFRKSETFIELGCGLGLLSRAAARRFSHAIGLDLEVLTARGVGAFPGNSEFIQHNEFVSTRLPQTSIDALVAWHVLEHLPDPHAVIGPFLDKIAKDGIFFGQIPLLKSEHVITAHHVFYRVETLIALLNPYGLEPVYFEKDESNGFLSFCFRKY